MLPWGKYPPSANRAGWPFDDNQCHALGRPTDRISEPQKEQGMLDVILLAGGVGFFIISIAYAYGCDHL